MIEQYVKVGATVCPRVQGISCAVVVAIEQNEDTGNLDYSVLTDFGNILTLTGTEFRTMYQNEKFYSSMMIGGHGISFFQDPHGFSVEDRFMLQIELLREAQEALLAKGLLKSKFL